ncbi:hypothetical protein GCM10010478_15770 [Streptomyces erythrogriseus]|uniref:Uncharacterized protein n=1 Tax=Streptomyces erythrogriseus TaxID=284027 RepID=A0ABP6J1K0_9ACTN
MATAASPAPSLPEAGAAAVAGWTPTGSAVVGTADMTGPSETIDTTAWLAEGAPGAVSRWWQHPPSPRDLHRMAPGPDVPSVSGAKRQANCHKRARPVHGLQSHCAAATTANTAGCGGVDSRF